MEESAPRGWAGVDVGKDHHWVCLIDEAETTLWSSKVINDEAAILDAISEVSSRADQVTWAVDVTGTMSGLLLALLAAQDQGVKYVPGRIVNKMADTYRGEARPTPVTPTSSPRQSVSVAIWPRSKPRRRW